MYLSFSVTESDYLFFQYRRIDKKSQMSILTGIEENHKICLFCEKAPGRAKRARGLTTDRQPGSYRSKPPVLLDAKQGVFTPKQIPE